MDQKQRLQPLSSVPLTSGGDGEIFGGCLHIACLIWEYQNRREGWYKREIICFHRTSTCRDEKGWDNESHMDI